MAVSFSKSEKIAIYINQTYDTYLFIIKNLKNKFSDLFLRKMYNCFNKNIKEIE
jgi:hypothetical protein